MTPESQVPKDENTENVEPVLALIKRIKENKLNPAVLSAEGRRRCVEVLWAEGYSVTETAQILQCGERTIYRDRKALRTANALRVHPDFAPETAGELMRHAEISISRLRRIAREPGASAMERLMAETAAFKVFLDMIGKLQSLGFLPRVPTNVVTQVAGAASDMIPTLDQLAHRIKVLDRVDQELGVRNPQDEQRRRALKELIERGRTAVDIEQMCAQIKEN